MAKLTIEEITEIVNACTYKPDWSIHLHDDGERLYVQIEATTLDSITKEPTTWKSGKTYLSPFMCRQEIVGAVFGAIEKAEIHEMREFFRYRGASIYNPHLDPDVLVEVAKKKESFNVRDNPMDMVEEKGMPAPEWEVPKDLQKVVVGQEEFYFVTEEQEFNITYKCYKSIYNEAVRVDWEYAGSPCSTTYRVEAAQNFVDSGDWVVVESPNTNN